MSVLFVQNEVCDARGKEFIELSEASSRQMGRKQFWGTLLCCSVSAELQIVLFCALQMRILIDWLIIVGRWIYLLGKTLFVLYK